MKPRFAIGQRFTTRGKSPRVCIATDILTTRNVVGDVVKVRYVATHVFMGQPVTDCDVTEMTIAMGLIGGE